MSKSIVRISRRSLLESDGGGTLFFVIHSGRRPGFLDPDQVPEFEGKEAWFEVERTRVTGRIWTTWKVLRQVDAPRDQSRA